MSQEDFIPPIPSPTPPRKQARPPLLPQLAAHDVDAMTVRMAGILEENADASESSEAGDDSSTSSEYGESELESDAQSSGNESKNTPSDAPNQWIRAQFREYCAEADKENREFTADEIATIRLMHLLKEKKAPMNAFESVMLWHLRERGKIHDCQGLGDYPGYIGRKTMLKRLEKRYNFENKMPFERKIKLPVSGTIVKITCHDAKATIQRLLTDPRIKATDYLFFDDDPLQGPPETLEFIEDLNTGLAYRETYARIIDQNKREQLLAVVIYFDGTAVSHFHDMEITQVNIALGNMTRLARTKAYCWAPLGYVEKIHEQGGRGREMLQQANHMETQDAPDSDDDAREKVAVMSGIGTKNDQDFHCMMSAILDGFKELQDTGFLWDHHNPATGAETKDIHYKLFVPFLKVDSEEGDLACGKYGQRTNTQQICRKCHVPLQRADDHLAKYASKTVPEIKKLIDNADLEGLQALSQTYLRNAFCGIRFSLGNDRGVHGSCPSELLHAFLLGTFKCIRDIFFEMVGKTSERARLIDALSKICGKAFARTSDRTLPNTAFGRGIQAGKLMAKDYRGALLVILAICHSTKGRKILSSGRSKAWKDSTLDDWILLVELMLEWESYLNEPKMNVKHVKRLEKKHRYIMYIMRKVAQRTAGMGLKLLKFHMILHIWEDILQFGVPLEYDTSANESMHKPSKQASKMTQKAHDTFNYQTANRLVEFELLDLAMEEIENCIRVWDYYSRADDDFAPDSSSEDGSREEEIWTGETRVKVHWEDDGEPGFKMCSRSKFVDQTCWTTQVIEFLLDLQDKIRGNSPEYDLPIFTCHKRKGQVFRGHPNFRGKGHWRDWVWINWGKGYGRLPAHIWCFVSLEGGMTTFRGLEHGGIALEKGVYAVVETATRDDEGQDSDLVAPYLKEVELDGDNDVHERTFYLADTEAFLDPCCCIPDIGGPPNRYFVVEPRNKWASIFISWVNDEHILDEMEDLTEDEGDEDVENEEESSVGSLENVSKSRKRGKRD